MGYRRYKKKYNRSKGMSEQDIDILCWILFFPIKFILWFFELNPKKTLSNDVSLYYGVYKDYMSSDIWKAKSYQFRKSSGGFCKICKQNVGFHSLDVHHLHYVNDPYQNDTSSNWIAVCRPCHDVLHEIKNGRM